ncbi:IS110 family transposase, partial [Algivirga pacifica]|uniref:IS110 family transposase n=1 Tax=Algivirga pacifica TaxID=1162670 RepID=UPI0031F08FE2
RSKFKNKQRALESIDSLQQSQKDFKVVFLHRIPEGSSKIKGSRTFDNSSSGFLSFKVWYEKRQQEKLPCSFVLEATGNYHEQLAWFLFEQQQRVHVVLANRAKSYLKSLGLKSKTDQIDAKGLAQMGADQQLATWQPLSKSLYTLRGMTRHHEDLCKVLVQLKNQQKQLAHNIYVLKEVSKGLEETLAVIEKQLEKIEGKIKSLIEKDEALHKKVACITSIKGVGLITAAVVVAETNGFALISNVKQLTSYAGYDVRENQSGQRRGTSSISKKGNSHIRRIMHMAALNVVRYEVGGFKNLQQRIYERSGYKMKGYVAVQSKLLKLMYTLWKTEQYFDPDYDSKKKENIIEKTLD